jgi:hypothetical protein
MGTTTNHALPYPEPADRLRGGSVAIKALANKVDAVLAWPVGVLIAPGESAKTAAALVDVDFPGVVGTLEQFTRVGDGFRFDGTKARSFLVSAAVEIAAGANPGVASMSSTVSLLVDGTVLEASFDKVDAATSPDNVGLIRARNVVHRMTVPVTLAPGQTVVVTASGAGGSTIAVGVTSVRIFPIGPA